MTNNEEIKERLRVEGIRQYLLATQLDVSEATLGRWLRFPLPEEKYREILTALEQLVADKGGRDE